MNINIKGFKGVKELDITGSGVNLIAGGNSSGKSGIKEAVFWLLTDKIEGGELNVIHRDYPDAEVSMEFNGTKIVRRQTRSMMGSSYFQAQKDGIDIGFAMPIPDFFREACTFSPSDIMALISPPDMGAIANKYEGNKEITDLLIKKGGIAEKMARSKLRDMDAISDLLEGPPSTINLTKAGKVITVDLNTVNLPDARQRLTDLHKQKEEIQRYAPEVKGKSSEEIKKEMDDQQATLLYLEEQNSILLLLEQEKAVLACMEGKDCPLYNVNCNNSQQKIDINIEKKKNDIKKLTSRLQYKNEKISEEIYELQKSIHEKDEVVRYITSNPDYESNLKAVIESIVFGKAVIEAIERRNFWNDIHHPLIERKVAFQQLIESLSAIRVKPDDQRMTSVIARFSNNCQALGLKVDVDLSKDTISLHGINLAASSRSQQYLTWIAMMEAVASEIAFPFLLIDGLDVLDPINKMNVFNLCLDKADAYEGILILSTITRLLSEDGKLVMKPGNVLGITSWWLDEGMIKPLLREHLAA